MKFSKFILLSLIFLLFISLIIFCSCSIGKRLDKPQSVVIKGTSNIYNFSGNSSKYYNQQELESYLSEFYGELSQELQFYNIEVINDFNGSNSVSQSLSKVYVLKIDECSITEDYETETVITDTIYNSGETYYITTCSVDVYYQISNADGFGVLKSSSVSFEKSEDLNTNRTFWQVVFGTNKDNSEYNYKELDQSIYYDLYKKAARRIAAKTSRIISKNL